MKYEIKAIEGIKTDVKVQAALAKLNKYEPVDRTVTVEIKHDKAKKTSTCKISALGKRPIIGMGENPGVAVRDAVKKFTSTLSNEQKAVVDKREHARKKANKVEEVVEEETFEM